MQCTTEVPWSIDEIAQPLQAHIGASCLADASAKKASIRSTIRGGHLETSQALLSVDTLAAQLLRPQEYAIHTGEPALMPEEVSSFGRQRTLALRQNSCQTAQS